MITQSFVVSSSSLAWVQLDLHQKKLVQNQTVPLAPGVVYRGVLQDSAQFAQALQSLIGHSVQKVDHTVLVISEDTVISKSLDLPRLAEKELSEAVHWEAERFFPLQKDQMVMDWKMLEANGSFHILFQAVTQSLIDRYLAIFDAISLPISGIETPALAMVRLAEAKPGVRLLIHVSPSEATITLAKNDEVIATSVIAFAQSMDKLLLKTVADMSSYYRAFTIEWIQIGGAAVDQAMVKTLGELQLPVTGFALPFPIPATIANHYLLAISAALKPKAPPQDQKTINLLPAWYVAREYQQFQRRYWKGLLQIAVVTLLGLWMGVAGVFIWLLQQERAILARQQTTSPVVQQAQVEAAQANQLAKQSLTMTADDYFPFGLLTALDQAKTDQIRFAKMQFLLSERKGLIQAIADNRMAMLAFKQAVDELEHVEQVVLPVSSFAEEEQIPFQLNIILSKELPTLETSKNKTPKTL